MLERSAKIAQSRQAEPRPIPDRHRCRIRLTHPGGYLRQRPVELKDDQHPALPEPVAAHNGHLLAAARVKGVVNDRLTAMISSSMRLVRRERAKRTLPSRSLGPAFVRVPVAGSSTSSISSTSWKPRGVPVGRDASPITWPASTSSCSTSSAICPSPRPADNCCST